MPESWKAFFYGAFDPAATVTIDKLAGSFLPQALSARIFGFHPWSLALPQVIEGVVSVLVLYRIVRRWVGVTPGLIAAPTGLRRRLGQLAAAGAVMLAVSLSWILLYTFTPAADRPYIDGSQAASIASWVERNCKAVPAKDCSAGSGGSGSGGSQALYACSPTT